MMPLLHQEAGSDLGFWTTNQASDPVNTMKISRFIGWVGSRCKWNNPGHVRFTLMDNAGPTHCSTLLDIRVRLPGQQTRVIFCGIQGSNNPTVLRRYERGITVRVIKFFRKFSLRASAHIADLLQKCLRLKHPFCTPEWVRSCRSCIDFCRRFSDDPDRSAACEHSLRGAATQSKWDLSVTTHQSYVLLLNGTAAHYTAMSLPLLAGEDPLTRG